MIYNLISILKCFQWSLDYLPWLKDHVGIYVPGFAVFIYQLIQTTFLIMACDRIERCGLDIVIACIRLQRNMVLSPISGELDYLKKYLEKLAPKFTLAGCILVNRQTLASLIPLIASYLIVIIQQQ
nr:uncharacterized protein LOC111512853 [Leptinotarsa decemlineata]